MVTFVYATTIATSWTLPQPNLTNGKPVNGTEVPTNPYYLEGAFLSQTRFILLLYC